MERRGIAIRGTVQGVGFRPFVYRLASGLKLCGFVKNHTGGVRIEVEGETASLDLFLTLLRSNHPPLATIDDLYWEAQTPKGDAFFFIQPSEANADGAVVICPDVATCEDCLAELFDPLARRYRYPFLNCTNCGPRLTIVTGAPYDRPRTTMAGFPLCGPCRTEYENPVDRRFHAQPTACPTCGPKLALLGSDGQPSGGDPLDEFAKAMLDGRIGAVKGLGGYHLACDARNARAVGELRRRKHRDCKPFAIMVRAAKAAEALCEVNETERTLLESPRRPILLLHKRADTAGGVADVVAPGNPCLGIMLAYAPLHHLLLEAVGDIPLVMTSGNRSDEPIAYQDADAVERLSGIADLFLTHNRPIHVRCDDSVTRVIDGEESPVRRSRGYAPQPVALPLICTEQMVAVGGQLKGTFALGRDRQAILSHHLGDLDHYEAYQAFERDIALYEELFSFTPKWIAHDLHPDYASTRYALRRQAKSGVRCLAVQHHHAHMASCMAENGLLEPVIGVSLDGTGYGTDGCVWGGEFLVGDYGVFRRAAHLRYVGMPGGEQAVHEPWRMALAHGLDAGCNVDLLARRVDGAALRTASRMLERGFNSPLTSSAGRLFDAAAALAGVRDQVSFEGQAAMELEWLATGQPSDGAYPFTYQDLEVDSFSGARAWVIDTRPLICGLVEDVGRGVARAIIGRRFHSTMVELIHQTCLRIRQDRGLRTVVLSGGVFMNALLTSEASARLEADGFYVYRHRQVPPNDGGLSLGQVAVAARQIANLEAAATEGESLQLCSASHGA